MSILMLIVTLLIGVPAIAGVPVTEESYRKAAAELEEKGSVPLIDALSVAKSTSALRKETQKIQLELKEKSKEKTDLEEKIKKLADTDPNKEELEQQVAVLSTQITNRETDLTRINKSIENAHGSIVSGSANAIVSIPPSLNERSDAHIQAVAEVVGGIVTNILDTDDTGQLCWAYLTTAERKDEKVLEACLKYVNSNTATRIKAVDLLLARARVQLTELERLPSTEKERERRDALERQLTDSIRGILKEGHVGIIQRKP